MKLVKGGQGRTGGSIGASAVILAVAWGALAILLALAVITRAGG